eukprot:2590991-Prymnesium_polylepis.1
MWTGDGVSTSARRWPSSKWPCQPSTTSPSRMPKRAAIESFVSDVTMLSLFMPIPSERVRPITT